MQKHSNMLARLSVTQPLAVTAALPLAANNRKFRPLIVQINQPVKLLIWCCRF